ncbi:hypothetical protein [Paraliobacillus sp. PM-2]|uniref:hypothetical protein n=1 Tax=Paraliobacillus sp. PM-2 TaxID=1462524 RepID=UPI00350E3868
MNKLLASYFPAVAPRTTGFNTIDIGSMEDASLLFIIMLMFIGRLGPLTFAFTLRKKYKLKTRHESKCLVFRPIRIIFFFEPNPS